MLDGEQAHRGATRVTPTRRLAHYLRARHDEACAAHGLLVWPTPDIVPWSAFIERLFAADRRDGRLHGRWLAENQARLIWERIAERDPATSGLIAPGQLGRTAYESWRRLHAYRIPVEALREAGTPEAAAFARWAHEYTTWLDATGWVDPSSATNTLGVSMAGAAEIVLEGFDVRNPAQEALIARLTAAGTSVVQGPGPPSAGRTSWVECTDRSAELEAAARWAAHRLDRDSEARLAIVVPALAERRDEVRRNLEQILVPDATLTGGPRPGSRGFTVAAARRLADWPLVEAALELVSAFVHGSNLAVAGRLLGSPYLLGVDSEEDARARLDANIRRHEGPDLDLARLIGLAEARDCPMFARAASAGQELSRRWSRRALPSDWSRRWFELLTAIGWPGANLDSDEHQAQERWQALLGEFGACDDLVGALPARTALDLLRDLAEGVPFEAQESPARLLVIEPEACAGMHFDGIWVCGLDASRWPPAASPDPFLPRDWQARQRMPGATAQLAAEQAGRMLDRLCRSGDEIILSVPQFDGDSPLMPSELLVGIRRGNPPAVWQGPSVDRASFEARPSLEILVDAAMPVVLPGEASRGGARLLELQSACPFRAQAELRLGATVLEEPQLGVAAAERGEIVHKVLRRIWQSLHDLDGLRKLDETGRLAVIRAAVAAELAVASRGVGEVMRCLFGLESAWLEARIAELLEADLARTDFAIDCLEASRALTLGGLTMNLRIDRVDRLADGGLAVIDYKTGGEADVATWGGERPALPQLPLYAESLGVERVAAVAFGRVRTGETGYCGVARDAATFPGLTSPGEKGWPADLASWQELLLAWRRRLQSLAEEHAAGDAHLAPDPPHACRYCHLAGLCRIGETTLERAPEATNEA